MSAPREFWIPKDYQCDFHSGIHVIEYSAFKDMKEKRDYCKDGWEKVALQWGEMLDRHRQMIKGLEKAKDHALLSGWGHMAERLENIIIGKDEE